MTKRVCIFACALVLTACGGSYNYDQMQRYVDQCIIDAGPQSQHNNVNDYCAAKWRQSQRDVDKADK